MGFWDTFVKVWQVRTSMKIQESLEKSYFEAKEKAKFQANVDEIIKELETKNKTWDDKISYHRNQTEN